MKIKLKQVIVKPNNTSIIIYYSKDGKEMRLSTGVSISNKKTSNGNYADWDYNRNRIKPNVKDYEQMNQKIELLETKGNRILSDLFKKNITPPAAELEGYMFVEERIIAATNDSLLTELYQKFLEMKRQHFESKGTLISLKDFTSTKNLIDDFEIYKNTKYKLYQFDSKWYKDMLVFMRLPHKADSKGKKIYKTTGAMNGKTCKKRFDIFLQFAEYLKEHGMCQQDFIDNLKKYRRTEIKVPKTDKVTLEIDEVHALYDYKCDNKTDEEIRDTFVFICLTGLRYGDYLRFDTKFLKKSSRTGDSVYERKAAKTKGSSGLNYKIPMCNIALEIITKYNGILPKPRNPNKDIKDLLQKTELFNEFTQVIDKSTGMEKEKYKCIAMHKGRDTFITNLVDVTPLNQLMKYTGHSKISTLQGYIDTQREVDTEPIKIFNR
jgi:integrase